MLTFSNTLFFDVKLMVLKTFYIYLREIMLIKLDQTLLSNIVNHIYVNMSKCFDIIIYPNNPDFISQLSLVNSTRYNANLKSTELRIAKKKFELHKQVYENYLIEQNLEESDSECYEGQEIGGDALGKNFRTKSEGVRRDGRAAKKKMSGYWGQRRPVSFDKFVDARRKEKKLGSTNRRIRDKEEILKEAYHLLFLEIICEFMFLD